MALSCTSAAGFHDSNSPLPPVIQFAFAYTEFAPVIPEQPQQQQQQQHVSKHDEESECVRSGVSLHDRLHSPAVVARRLRVFTVRLPIAVK